MAKPCRKKGRFVPCHKRASGRKTSKRASKRASGRKACTTERWNGPCRAHSGRFKKC